MKLMLRMYLECISVCAGSVAAVRSVRSAAAVPVPCAAAAVPVVTGEPCGSAAAVREDCTQASKLT